MENRGRRVFKVCKVMPGRKGHKGFRVCKEILVRKGRREYKVMQDPQDRMVCRVIKGRKAIPVSMDLRV